MELREDNFLNGLLDVLEKKRTDPENYEWQDVADYFTNAEGESMNRNYIRNSSRFLFNFLDAGYKLTPPEKEAGSQKAENKPGIEVYDANSGQYTYDRKIELIPGESITPLAIMKAHGLDPSKWEVVNYRNSNWQSAVKDGKPITLVSSRITVKPLKQTQVTFEDIEAWFNSKDFKAKPKCPKFEYNDSEEYLHIDLTDSHVGLLTYNLETGNDYDVKIATDRIRMLFDDIVQRSKGKRFKGVTIATLGDILHVDNSSNTTSHGTSQDTEGRITKWYGEALDMMVDCIDKILELKSPVKYVYLCGNHDTATGSMLAMSLSRVYKNNENIEFDVRPLPQKAVVYGETIIGLCHGDMPKKNLTNWMTKDFRKEFGDTKFAQIHCGHLHNYNVTPDNNILIYHLPSICESSYWEKSKGYTGERGMMCFVYNEKTGMRDQWNSYI